MIALIGCAAFFSVLDAFDVKKPRFGADDRHLKNLIALIAFRSLLFYKFIERDQGVVALIGCAAFFSVLDAFDVKNRAMERMTGTSKT